MRNIAEGNQLLALIDRMRGAFVGRDEIVQRGAEVTRNVNTTYTIGSTAITFNSVIKDTGTFWVAGSPTRLTAKVEGWYVCSANMLIDAEPVAGVNCLLSIRKNGSTSIAIDNEISVVNTDIYINAARVTFLNSNDYIEMLITHDRGGGGTMEVVSTAYSPVLSLVRYP